MKKLLIILIWTPIIGVAQDIQLPDIKNKKVMQKIEKKLEREYNKTLKMNPKDQLGYITNLDAHPWGGFSFFNHWGKYFGWYIDWRPAMNQMHPEYWTETLIPQENPDLHNQTLWISITNGGLSIKIFSNQKRAIMMYGGYGIKNTKLYSGYYVEGKGNRYYENDNHLSDENYNIGLLFQSKRTLSWQIGFDSSLSSGINFGVGLTFN